MNEEFRKEIIRLLTMDLDYEDNALIARKDGARILQGVSNGWLSAKLFGFRGSFFLYKQIRKGANIKKKVLDVLYGMGRKVIIKSEEGYDAVLRMGGIGKPSLIMLRTQDDLIEITICTPKSFFSIFRVRNIEMRIFKKIQNDFERYFEEPESESKEEEE